jgi:hypothetical protein
MSDRSHTEVVPDLIRALYEGSGTLDASCLHEDLFFSDPLVRVGGKTKVLRMFGKLTGFFAATQVANLEVQEAQGSESTWALEVHYKRSPDATPKVFKSTLVVTGPADAIETITEHWHAPWNMAGGRRGLMPRPLRAALGWVFS